MRGNDAGKEGKLRGKQRAASRRGEGCSTEPMVLHGMERSLEGGGGTKRQWIQATLDDATEGGCTYVMIDRVHRGI
jgi:hypothetical protein